MLPSLVKFLKIAAILAVSTAMRVHALPFLYEPGDLTLGLRKTDGTTDITVNLGRYTLFSGMAPGSSTNLAAYSQAQLNAAFTDLNSLRLSITGAARPGDSNIVSADLPETNLPTIWVTRARTSPNTQTTPWNRQSATALGNSASRIRSIGVNATNYSRGQLAGPNNTTTTVLIPRSDALSYSVQIGTGNLNNTFQGSVEATTPAGFSTGGTAVRLDLYELRPGSGASKHLGFFEFTPQGQLTFTAAGGAAPVPTLSIADASVTEGTGGTAQLSFLATLSSAAASEVSVSFETVSGSAESVTDFTPTSGRLVFAPGETTKAVVVPVVTDSLAEADESFVVRLSAPTGATLARAEATGRITNDDLTPLEPTSGIIELTPEGVALSHPSVLGLVYSLHWTNQAGLTEPVSRWATSSTNQIGTGAVLRWNQPATDPTRFYSIGVRR